MNMVLRVWFSAAVAIMSATNAAKIEIFNIDSICFVEGSCLPASRFSSGIEGAMSASMVCTGGNAIQSTGYTGEDCTGSEAGTSTQSDVECDVCSSSALVKLSVYEDDTCSGDATYSLTYGMPLGCNNGTLTECSSSTSLTMRAHMNAECFGYAISEFEMSDTCLYGTEFKVLECGSAQSDIDDENYFDGLCLVEGSCFPTSIVPSGVEGALSASMVCLGGNAIQSTGYTGEDCTGSEAGSWIQLDAECDVCSSYTLVKQTMYESDTCSGDATYSQTSGLPLGCTNGITIECSGSTSLTMGIHNDAECSGDAAVEMEISDTCLDGTQMEVLECGAGCAQTYLFFVWALVAKLVWNLL